MTLTISTVYMEQLSGRALHLVALGIFHVIFAFCDTAVPQNAKITRKIASCTFSRKYDDLFASHNAVYITIDVGCYDVTHVIMVGIRIIYWPQGNMMYYYCHMLILAHILDWWMKKLSYQNSRIT